MLKERGKDCCRGEREREREREREEKEERRKERRDHKKRPSFFLLPPATLRLRFGSGGAGGGAFCGGAEKRERRK